jgi:hypothetical protein
MYVMRTGVCVWTGARVKRRGVASSNKQKRQSQSKLRFKPPAGGEPLLTTTTWPPIWPVGGRKTAEDSQRRGSGVFYPVRWRATRPPTSLARYLDYEIGAHGDVSASPLA